MTIAANIFTNAPQCRSPPKDFTPAVNAGGFFFALLPHCFPEPLPGKQHFTTDSDCW
jgi:hypothetical protein